MWSNDNGFHFTSSEFSEFEEWRLQNITPNPHFPRSSDRIMKVVNGGPWWKGRMNRGTFHRVWWLTGVHHCRLAYHQLKYWREEADAPVCQGIWRGTQCQNVQTERETEQQHGKSAKQSCNLKPCQDPRSHNWHMDMQGSVQREVAPCCCQIQTGHGTSFKGNQVDLKPKAPNQNDEKQPVRWIYVGVGKRGPRHWTLLKSEVPVPQCAPVLAQVSPVA